MMIVQFSSSKARLADIVFSRGGDYSVT